jgi:S-(hydroxymethyl)glutathione dehydrogenase / alcohol dehydrogenase
MRALVTREHNACVLEEVELRAVGPHDVLVRLEASGICHSDVSLCNGTLGGDLPVVLGHEGAGTVVEVGREVTLVQPNDRVVLAAIAPCGSCWFCGRAEPYLCTEISQRSAPSVISSGRPIRGASGLGTFAEMIVVDEHVAVAVTTDLPADQLAVIGCAVLTGAGAVLNITKTRPGERVLIVGAGGIGLSAIQAAAAAGATTITAVDPSAEARSQALASGATHAFDPSDPALAGALTDLTFGIGFDAAFDCVGAASTFATAWAALRRGGELVLIGIGPAEVRPPIGLAEITLSARRISGCTYGSSSVRRDIPIFVAMAEAGRLDLAALLGRTVPLSDAAAAVLGEHRGPGRTVIVPG